MPWKYAAIPTISFVSVGCAPMISPLVRFISVCCVINSVVFVTVLVLDSCFVSVSLFHHLLKFNPAGGLAEWFPTYLTRYCGFTIADAGLWAGAVTVLGGIFGAVLGSKVADWVEHRWPGSGSYFLVPALFAAPGAALLLVVVNLPSPNQGVIIFLILIGEVSSSACLICIEYLLFGIPGILKTDDV